LSREGQFLTGCPLFPGGKGEQEKKRERRLITLVGGKVIGRGGTVFNSLICIYRLSFEKKGGGGGLDTQRKGKEKRD